MANIINQLEISGITYDIQDNDAQNTLLTKQDALVSGVNIKTINNESLLGSGNIVIEGGTGDAYTKAETDALLANKADVSAVTSAVTEFSAALGNEIQRAQGVEQVLSGAIDTKVDSNDVYLKSSTSSSTEINNALQAKADASTTYSKTEVDTAINAATSGKADTTAVTSAVSEFTTALSGEIQRAQGVEQVLSGAIDGKQATLVSGTNIKTINNQSLLGSGNIDIQGGSGANVVELTQAQYDALATKDPDTFYIITDATPIDTSTFYTTAQTSSSTQIATALSDKQNVLTAGSGIAISNDVISVTGGGGGTIDAALDANSPNAVANSAITAGINNAVTSVTAEFTNVYTALAGKQPMLTAGTGIDITDNVISVTGGGGGGTIDAALDANSPNAVANSAITAGIDAKANKSAAIGGYAFGASNNVDNIQFKNVNSSNIGHPIYYPKINNKGILTSNLTYASANYDFQLVETSAITTTLDSSSTDSQVPSAKAVYDIIGNINALLSAI